MRFPKEGISLEQQATKAYKVSDCFQITLPEEWNVRYPVTLIADPPDHNIQVNVTASRHSKPDRPDIDHYMSRLQENVLRLKDVRYTLEESGSLHIDGHEARRALFSFYDTVGSPETKNYWLIYRVQSDEYAYTINFAGLYDRLATNRPTISQAVSNFKILK